MARCIVACSAALMSSRVRGVHALAAAKGVEVSAPGGEPLGLSGDLLGVDGVLVHARTGVRLVVAGPVRLALGVAHLDLETLARSGLLRDRAEGLERRRLLLDLERRGRAPLGQRSARLVADEAVEAGTALVDPGHVCVLGGEERLGFRRAG